MGEEIVGSYLYQVHLYEWLDSHDYGRFYQTTIYKVQSCRFVTPAKHEQTV